MKLINKTLSKAVLTLVLISPSTFADWNVGVGYSQFSEKASYFDLSLSAVTIGAGYIVENKGEKWSFMPGVRLGFGTNDQEIGYRAVGNLATIEIENFIALDLRGNLNITDNLTFYVQPSYGNLSIKASNRNDSVSEDEWELGLGAGVQYSFTDIWAVEIQYEDFDGTDVVSAAIRYSF